MFEKGWNAAYDKNKLAELTVETNKQDKQIEDMQTEWYNFVQKHQNVLNNEDLSGGKKSDKSYWGMLWRFIIADVIAIFLVSLLITILILPIAGIGGLTKNRSPGISTFLALIFGFVAGLGQVYFWILWAAFCVFHMNYYMDAPTVSYNWLYYLTGFIVAVAPMSYLSSKEQDTAESDKERNSIAFGSSMYILLTIIAFIVFCVYPNLMEYKLIPFINALLTKH